MYVFGYGKDGFCWLSAQKNLRGYMDVMSCWTAPPGCSEDQFLDAVAKARFSDNQSVKIFCQQGVFERAQLIWDKTGRDVWAPVDRRVRGTPCYEAAVKKAQTLLECDDVRHNYIQTG